MTIIVVTGSGVMKPALEAMLDHRAGGADLRCLHLEVWGWQSSLPRTFRDLFLTQASEIAVRFLDDISSRCSFTQKRYRDSSALRRPPPDATIVISLVPGYEADDAIALLDRLCFALRRPFRMIFQPRGGTTPRLLVVSNWVCCNDDRPIDLDTIKAIVAEEVGGYYARLVRTLQDAMQMNDSAPQIVIGSDPDNVLLLTDDSDDRSQDDVVVEPDGTPRSYYVSNGDDSLFRSVLDTVSREAQGAAWGSLSLNTVMDGSDQSTKLNLVPS